MKLSEIATTYNVNIEMWDGDDPEVTVIEEISNVFVGWYVAGPFICTIHIKDGICTSHEITET